MIFYRPPNEDELRYFLVLQKGFKEKTINNGLERLINSKGKINQSRLDCFFKSQPIPMKVKKLSKAERKKIEQEDAKAVRIKAKMKESAFSKNKAGKKDGEVRKPGRPKKEKKELNPQPSPVKKSTWVERASLSYSAGFTVA
jgi:hypothetical protein